MPSGTLREATAGSIAGDLAMAIYTGQIAPRAQVPSQRDLMKTYGVAEATAASALRKLARAALVRSQKGIGTYVLPWENVFGSPVIETMTAATVCRNLAAKHNSEPCDPDCRLEGLDRTVLLWMGETLLAQARRMVEDGPSDTDRYLVAAARAIIFHGAQRPLGQEPLTLD